MVSGEVVGRRMGLGYLDVGCFAGGNYPWVYVAGDFFFIVTKGRANGILRSNHLGYWCL